MIEKIVQNQILPPVYIQPKEDLTIYADGLSQMILGFPNSRLSYHRMLTPGIGDVAETRQVVCELVVPTPALIESLELLISHLSSNHEEMAQVGQEWMNKVINQLRQLAPLAAPK